MFDPNADPELIAARAAELALEQHERLRSILKRRPDDPKVGSEFYGHPFEASISNKIASLMCAYAVLKGYQTLEQATR